MLITLTRRDPPCAAVRSTLREHSLQTLVAQRVHGIALGYEDLNDHDDLRRDPVLALLSDGLEKKRANVAPLAGKSTLNRLEHAPADAADRAGSFLISMPRTTPFTASRKAAFSTAITAVIAICRFMSSAAGIFWPPS